MTDVNFTVPIGYMQVEVLKSRHAEITLKKEYSNHTQKTDRREHP